MEIAKALERVKTEADKIFGEGKWLLRDVTGYWDYSDLERFYDEYGDDEPNGRYCFARNGADIGVAKVSAKNGDFIYWAVPAPQCNKATI